MAFEFKRFFMNYMFLQLTWPRAKPTKSRSESRLKVKAETAPNCCPTSTLPSIHCKTCFGSERTIQAAVASGKEAIKWWFKQDEPNTRTGPWDVPTAMTDDTASAVGSPAFTRSYNLHKALPKFCKNMLVLRHERTCAFAIWPEIDFRRTCLNTEPCRLYFTLFGWREGELKEKKLFQSVLKIIIKNTHYCGCLIINSFLAINVTFDLK